jgi:hypothetical protein
MRAAFSAYSTTLPPVVPLALMSDAAVVLRSPEARRKIRPPSRTALEALMRAAVAHQARGQADAPGFGRDLAQVRASPGVPVMATETPGVAGVHQLHALPRRQQHFALRRIQAAGVGDAWRPPGRCCRRWPR